MKTIYLFPIFLFYLLAGSLTINAQFLASNAPCNNQADNPGAFDWTASHFTVYTISQGVQNIESPFHMSSVTNRNVALFSIYADKDYLPADGWELLQKNFGSSGNSTDFPYFILYNKNTGMLRIFVALAQLYGQNDAATITLTYGDYFYRTALLEYYNGKGIQQPLNNFTNNVPSINVNNFYDNQALYWLHADFTLNYDPCVCNYNNSLLFLVKFSSSSTIQFTIDGTLIQSFDKQGRNASDGNTSFLTQLQETTASAYKDVSNVKKLADTIKNTANKWIALATQNKDFFNSFTSGLSAAGSVLGAANFLVSLFGNAAPAPLVFDINMKANGTITHTAPYGSINLVNPGSYQQNLASIILPVYNNSMGVFNILSSPVLKVYNVESQYYGWNDCGSPDGYYYWEKDYFYIDDIKYVINPNSDISMNPADIDIRARLINGQYMGGNLDAFLPIGCLKNMPLTYETTSFYYPCTGDHDFPPTLDQVYKLLEVVAKLKTTSNKEVVLKFTYPISKIEYISTTPVFQDPTTCTTFLAPATTAEIQQTCNSTLYQNKASQFTGQNRIIMPTTATENTDNKNKETIYDAVKVYPNPTSGVCVVTIPDKAGILKSFTITDICGKIIQKGSLKISSGQRTFNANLTNSPAGMYILTIQTANSTITQKIIKQ